MMRAGSSAATTRIVTPVLLGDAQKDIVGSAVSQNTSTNDDHNKKGDSLTHIHDSQSTSLNATKVLGYSWTSLKYIVDLKDQLRKDNGAELCDLLLSASPAGLARNICYLTA